MNTVRSKENPEDGSANANQQQDWSILWSCFENPLSLLSVNSGLPKGMKEMVSNAVSEMRRYYSRKVIDVLIKVTRASLDLLRKRFVVDDDETQLNGVIGKTLEISAKPIIKPIFLVHSTLMIPNVAIRPTLDELQEALITAGKNITGVAKGVAQWTSGKEVSGQNFSFNSFLNFFFFKQFSHHKDMFDHQDVMSKMISAHVDANYIIYNRKNGHRCLT